MFCNKERQIRIDALKVALDAVEACEVRQFREECLVV
jgi:hypothetical protein